MKSVDDDSYGSDAEMFTVFRTQSKVKLYSVTVELNGVPLEMEVDTGASLSVISEERLTVVRLGRVFRSRNAEED